MKKTKQVAVTAVFIALYFVLASLLKIPVAGHITLDLGYIALTVGAVFLGAVPATFIGAFGALLESALLSRRGVSVGWVVMNAIIGFLCGYVLHHYAPQGKKKLMIAAVIVIPVSVLLGVAVKTVFDCWIYDLAFVAKIPSSLAAWLLDSLTMLVGGIPLSMALQERL